MYGIDTVVLGLKVDVHKRVCMLVIGSIINRLRNFLIID
jgi:hypothetical protein